ncbi:MAG: hypothetical protein ACLQGV_00815 [Bryobacteraceae bacterium]
MRALLRKDVWLHWKHFLMVCAGLILMVLMMRLAQARGAHPPRDDGVLLQFHLSMVFAASVLFSEWLVAQERARRTILWLRTLPVSDWQIVGSKFAVYLAMHWGLLLIGTAAVAPGWFRRYPVEIVRGPALIQVFGGMLLGSRLLLNPKVGLAGAAMVTLAATILYGVLGLGAVPAWVLALFWNVPGVLAGSLLLYAGAFWITAILLSRRETPEWAS